MDFKKLLKQPEYDFLRTNEHLGDNICLLTLGGSHAYGTNVEGSDVDIRGVAIPTKREVLLGRVLTRFWTSRQIPRFIRLAKPFSY